MIRKLIFVSAILIFALSSVCAQEKYHHHFTVADGLPSNVVYKTIQDEDGFLWICTEKGVALYDGYTFTTLKNIENKLKSTDVWELIIDKYKRKWIFSMDADPVIISNGKANFLEEFAPIKIGKLEVWSLNSTSLKYATNSIFLLVNYSDSTTYYLNKENKAINIPLPKNVVWDLKIRNITFCSFDDNKISLVYKSGLFATYDLKGNMIQSGNKYSFGIMQAIIQGEDINSNKHPIYIRNLEHLYKFENLQLDKLDYTITKSSEFSVVGSSKDLIFIKENDVLYTLDKNSFSNKKLLTKTIKGARHIFEDQENNIWISSQEDGIYLLPFHAKNTSIYNEKNGLTVPKVTAMDFDTKGNLYLGNNYGKFISVFNGMTFSTLPKSNLKDYFIHIDLHDNIWLTGINLISNKKYNLISNRYAKPKSSSQIHGKYVLNNYEIYPKSYCSNGTSLYFGRRNLYKVDLEQNTVRIDSIWNSDFTIYALEANAQKEIFVGTTNGVYVLNQKKNEVTKIQNENLIGNIRDIKFRNNTIWVANDRYGLVLYNLKTNKSQIIKELAQKTVSDIHYNKTNSTMWVSSNQGLFRIRINPKGDYEVQRYTTTNGLPANEVNCCLTRDNKIYVGTSEGLAIIKDEELNLSFEPKILTTSFNINGKEYPIAQFYNLKHNENHLIIKLTAFSFSSLGNIQYKYRLKGADNNWSTSNSRVLEYPNLIPGNYKFMAFAFDANGKKTSNEVRIAINIKSPITKTWWFQLLAGLLLISLLAWFFYWRSQEKNKKNLLEKQFSNLKLEALQSQLNSHFIFNALNAIQAYIIRKDERQASKYMSQFAKLMRAFLDSSRNRTISIQDEIDFIKTYISLEQIIYEDKFDSNIVIDPTLNTNTRIPSNIVQPFVENAILHGLMPLSRKGLLSIRFTKKNNLAAQCIIEDNGVGYHQSQKNKTIKSKSHGQNIIHERIAILKKDHELEVDIKIIDRKKEENKNGTIIIINFKNNGAN